MDWKYAGSSCRKFGRTNIVTGMCWSRRKSTTAGSRTWPSSIVKNTTGLVVGTREMTGATEPPWIATGVAGSVVGVVVVVVVLDVDVVVDRVATQIGRDTSELQSHVNLVCRLLLEKKKKKVRI